jgi:uncharacterized protein (TIGR02246 family)
LVIGASSTITVPRDRFRGDEAAAEGLTLSPVASDGASRFAVERSPMPARAVPLACLGALLLTGCDGAGQARPVDTARIVDAIKTDEVHWNADYKSGDAGRIARHYAPDAVAMHPGYPVAVGVAAIKAANEHAFTDPKYGHTFSSDRVKVAVSGDLAVAHGWYKETTTDPKSGQPVTATGSYVTVYKPDAAGVWRAVWDINTPGSAPSALEAAQ